ncbi:hypothetical protein [Acinetobacter sp. ANC 4805]|jgi:hypothetical protein|uniref:hypothetical protein n=1 Tax=Acinetobacter sp. ANC 4805 TaxID=2923425 RepID=UPI001F4BCCAE|nr:hypothetical protein [Acinetobacter sp. ANC 4805]MCH7312150.1 hypothetical protein [Acinetobacter sp. ANC 4805]
MTTILKCLVAIGMASILPACTSIQKPSNQTQLNKQITTIIALNQESKIKNNQSRETFIQRKQIALQQGIDLLNQIQEERISQQKTCKQDLFSEHQTCSPEQIEDTQLRMLTVLVEALIKNITPD